MSTAEQNSCFYSLPVEMKLEIFNNFDLPTVKAARAVCRTWNGLIAESLVLEPELSDETVSTVANSPLPVRLLAITHLQNPRSIPSSSRWRRSKWLDNVRHIIIEEPRQIEPVQQVQLPGASEENLRRILQDCSSKLQSLVFKNNCLTNLTLSFSWNRMAFDNVSHFRILLHTYDPHHHRAIDRLLSTHTFPKLVDLRISFTEIRTPTYFYPAKPYAQIFSTVYEFISRHESTLTNLWLHEAEELQLASTAPDDFPIPVRLSEPAVHSLMHLNLTRLRLFLGNYDENHPTWPAICLARNHSQLVTLDVWGAPVPAQFLNTIRNNLATLKYLYWTSDYTSPDHGLNMFDVSVLSKATQLVHLDLSANEILNFNSLPVQLKRLVWSSDLSTEQLIWVAKNMKQLKSLILEENEDNETQLPFITLATFKLVLQSAQCLELFKVYGKCDTPALTEFCQQTPGLRFESKPDTEEEDEMSRIKGRTGFRVMVDRTRLNPEHLA